MHATFIDIRKDKIKESLFSPGFLDDLRKRGGRWAVYQNHDIGHSAVGCLAYLAFGQGRTYQLPPSRYPDTPKMIGWRYVLVGEINFEKEDIVPYTEAIHGEN